ncbi:hypothetical protein KFL_007280100 [Klebsormidium nitens]|uniref:Uncharacterized protein n=1 Tax=Klebsormidium nitens TaxID=105231 RepID=A0A1Y1IPI8_KLENI|nr:hypothetical protein KFL_007280100 [Klebsormidium nitens]|eukprot:GAQ91111.1 hypothetical protein KFL_007280100 [Klebsormidium nitens]
MIVAGTTQTGLRHAYSRSFLLLRSCDKRDQGLYTSFLPSSNQRAFCSTPLLLASKGRFLRRQRVLHNGGFLSYKEKGLPLAQKGEKIPVLCLHRKGDAQGAAQDEAAKQHALRPHLGNLPRRGVIGKSRYAVRLRKEIAQAARDMSRGPVLLFGEPGLEKDDFAALIFSGSPDSSKDFVRLDCSCLGRSAVELFGRTNKRGVLYWLGDGTLLLENVHHAHPDFLKNLVELVRSGNYLPAANTRLEDWAQPEDGLNAEPVQHSSARIILTAEGRVPALDQLVTIIKVPPLRVRPSDIPDLTAYFLKQYCLEHRSQPIVPTSDALRTLETSPFPGNIKELQAVLERAAGNVQDDETQLTADVLWDTTKQGHDPFRLDLLKAYPPLRTFLRSDIWPKEINFRFTAYAFAIGVCLLLFGPQDREHNVVLTVFWAYWWPVIFLMYPFLGRVWCAICPFMIYGELVQRWRLSRGAQLLKWPRETAEAWGPWFLFAMFAGILLWEDVWHLSTHAALSGGLLILITSGAVICSAIFERRLWCRYLCPIGGMNGLFAKMSMTEVRARQGVCSATCQTYHCYKGGPAEPPEGLKTSGCPLHSHPAQLVDNKDCTLCMDCLKACPHTSVQFNLRAPGVDLWTTHKPAVSEVALMFMLLGGVYLHRAPNLLSQFGFDPILIDSKPIHIAVAAGLLSLPGVISYCVDALNRLYHHTQRTLAPAPFLHLAYGYLPLVWSATLAHYLPLLLVEGGTLLPVTAATVGFRDSGLPIAVADPSVVGLLQGAVLAGGMGLSLALTRKLGKRHWSMLWPQCATIFAFSAELWALFIQDVF